MTVQFSSGVCCQPFDWSESITHLTAEELADRFSESFPVILRESSGSDWAYAGWYQELLQRLHEGRLPIARYSDNYEDEIYRPMRLFCPSGGNSSELSLPPVFHP